MKLVTWNCQGAFRKKADIILAQKPDILVVQECEHPDKLIFNSNTQHPNDFLWVGENKNKGLGIFSYSDFTFQLIDNPNTDIKFVAPILVTNGKTDFILFAIWANNRNDSEGQYIEQVWKAVNYYEHLLNNKNLILTGDFNSNKIWDKKHRVGNHSTVVESLLRKEIYSVYHKYFEQEQGEEENPTFFLQRNLKKPYHIDYCFASNEMYKKVKSVEVGTFDSWITYSDHTPLLVDFALGE